MVRQSNNTSSTALFKKKLIPTLRDFKGQPLVFAEILMLLVESLFSYYTLEAIIGFG